MQKHLRSFRRNDRRNDQRRVRSTPLVKSFRCLHYSILLGQHGPDAAVQLRKRFDYPATL